MWNNTEWAQKHLNRRHPGITTIDAWEVVFEDKKIFPLRSPDELRWPPYRRYWTIGFTKKGLQLFVVWEVSRDEINLVTAFKPEKERLELYEKLKKKIKK